GRPALSSGRRAKLLSDLRRVHPEVRDVEVEWLHLFDVAAPLTREEDALLDKLLEYGPARAPRDLSGVELFVVPRIGTISPWSSKATDIARICGLTQVRRLERGRRI